MGATSPKRWCTPSSSCADSGYARLCDDAPAAHATWRRNHAVASFMPNTGLLALGSSIAYMLGRSMMRASFDMTSRRAAGCRQVRRHDGGNFRAQIVAFKKNVGALHKLKESPPLSRPLASIARRPLIRFCRSDFVSEIGQHRRADAAYLMSWMTIVFH